MSGNVSQNQFAIAIGNEAGRQSQGTQAIAIGNQAGLAAQQSNAIAIGAQSGENGQGNNAIAIGFRSGFDSLFGIQHDNTIVLNATGTELNTQGISRSYIKPIRDQLNENQLLYDISSGEITYNNPNVSPFQGIRAYGSFYDTGSHNMNPIYPRPVPFNQVDLSYGVFISNDVSGNPSEIRFGKNGVYDVQFSFQYTHTGGGSPQVFIWLRKNNVDVSWTNTKFFIPNEAALDAQFAAWNFFVTVTNHQTDFYQLIWIATDNSVVLTSIDPGPTVNSFPTPSIPSSVLTVSQIN